MRRASTTATADLASCQSNFFDGADAPRHALRPVKN